MNTIFALATPIGISAIAIIRISGNKAHNVLQHISKLSQLPEPHYLTYQPLYRHDGTMLDQAMILRILLLIILLQLDPSVD